MSEPALAGFCGDVVQQMIEPMISKHGGFEWAHLKGLFQMAAIELFQSFVSGLSGG